MKKIYIITPIILVAVFVLSFTVVKAVPLYYLPSAQFGGVASTTASYIIGGTGTSTLTKTFSSDGIEQASWLVAVASSTTPPTLCWKTEFSNNGTDWYGTDNFLASTTVDSAILSHNAGERSDCWKASTSTASTIISRGSNGVSLFVGRKIVISNLDTTHTRIIFAVNPGVNALVDIQRSLKNTVVTTK